MGEEAPIGSGAFGLAVGFSGNTVVTVNSGPERPSFTVLERNKQNHWEIRRVGVRSVDAPERYEATEWRGVSLGVAIAANHSVYVSEGDSGRVSLFDTLDERRHVFELNQEGYSDSFSGDLAYDAQRSILYAADQANFRIAVVDARSRRTLTSVPVGKLPFALALSPDRKKLYVTNLGLFQYRAIPGADLDRPRQSGLAFPAFGFPGQEALASLERRAGAGNLVAVPGLGDPNAPTSSSVAVIDVADPQSAKAEAFVGTGLPASGDVSGGSGPAGVVATADRVFVANSNQDSITVIDAHTNRVTGEIPLRIPGLEKLRGILPIGLAVHQPSGWLLVAEAGINAVGVVDPVQGRVLGHLPAAWFPTRVAVEGDTVFVTNARGHGVGPNVSGWTLFAGGALPSQLYQGTLSILRLPSREELAKSTARVMESNGFRPSAGEVRDAFPPSIRHVVVIVKEGRGYDELMGDITHSANGAVMGEPALAHLGSRGYVDGKHQHFSLKDVDVTPNHHALAHRWASSDNFYADSDESVGGHHWLAGVYPNAWLASSLLEAYGSRKEFRLGSAPGRLSFPGLDAPVAPEDLEEQGTLWDHLERHGISFAAFGEGFDPVDPHLLTNMPMPEALFTHSSRQYPGFDLTVSDQTRAARFIHEVDERYARTGADLPRFLFVYLPNDSGGRARPAAGYPYDESFVADNDYALGRIVEYLSASKWWKQMAIFVTEASARGADHIDAHRTLLLCAGPWAKRNYVSHRNTSFPGLLKTVFGLLGLPPLNLYDAAAADLSDCFLPQPDFTPYRAVEIDRRIFDPDLTGTSR
jgi:YVTN family beta-propeller protein